VTRNLAGILTGTAERHPQGTAYKLDDVTVPWAAVDEASARLAALLQHKGVGQGDRVGIMLPNVPYFPIAYYGILRAGATAVPMNVLLKGREVAFYLENPGAELLLAWHGFAEEAQKGAEQAGAEVISVAPGEFEQHLAQHEPDTSVADVRGEDTAVILYTSGTTGEPKGAELTHDNLRKNAQVSLDTLFDIGPDDVLLGALPLFHTFGQTVCMNCSTLGGATLTFIPRFDPGKALQIIERDRVTIFAGVPTMYNAMLNHPDRDKVDVSCLRLCASGGAAMPGETLRGFEEAFRCKILEGYGLSETSPVASFNHPDKERKIGSIGTPIEGVEMKVVDEQDNDLPTGEVGEIVIRGHNIMKGYWRREEATEEAMRGGWFHTGDMAKVDEDGYFFIVDRKKDMIIRGGYNVYPREVEEVLYQHPDVLECAVLGVPDESLGEEVGAVVVLKEGKSADAEDLQSYVKGEVAAYKYPRKVWFVDELPKGPTGKILKREIEAPAEVRAGRS
jgi:long-chain acyl-CoA synthetase